MYSITFRCYIQKTKQDHTQFFGLLLYYALYITGLHSSFLRPFYEGLEERGFKVNAFLSKSVPCPVQDSKKSQVELKTGIVAIVETEFFRQDTFQQIVDRLKESYVQQNISLEVIVQPLGAVYSTDKNLAH